MKTSYVSPNIKVIDVGYSRVLCDSEAFEVSMTEVETADRNVVSGGAFDSLY